MTKKTEVGLMRRWNKSWRGEKNRKMEKNGTGGDGEGRMYRGEEDREIKMERANI